METITKEQRNDLERQVETLKKRHPRKYKHLQLNLSDLDTGVMLGMKAPRGGLYAVTGFLSYEAMFAILASLINPIDKKLKDIEKAWKHIGID